MNEYTKKLLEKCADAGYTKIAIGIRHKSIPHSFDCADLPVKSDIFAGWPANRKEPRIRNWPAIWDILSELDLSWGCGNGHQHQIKIDLITPGIYHLKNGKWNKIEVEAK